jgi:PAS domain S-box-containing protein
VAFEDLFTRAVSPFSDPPANPILVRSWQQSQTAGVERHQAPSFRRVSAAELQQRQSASRTLLDVATPHLDWLSHWFHSRPHVAYLVDKDGIVLHGVGDADAVARYGLSPGFDWSESQMGTNGAGTALAAGVPVAVIGCDHWSMSWKDATCLGAPILGRDGTPVGAIDISMDVQEGDAERLVVAAYAAGAISQELARREAEAENREKDGMYETVRTAFEAERRARADADAALAKQHQAEAELRDSREQLTLALDKAEMGVWELDLTTGECVWSEQMAVLFGLPRGERAGTLARVVDLIDEEYREPVLQAKQAAAEGAAFDVELRTTWPDGTVHWINGKGRVTATRDGKGLRLIGVGQDITSRRHSESARRLSEHRLRTIIDSTAALVYVVDNRGRFLLVNRQFARLFALDAQEVVGRSLYDCFPAEVADQFAANNQKVVEMSASGEFEEVVPQRDGPHTYVSVKAPLYDPEGVPYAICGVSTDITERERLMAALEVAQRQKDAVIATIAHELRQPLAAIQGALAMMRARVTREKGERARTILERQVAQLSRLVDDLLDASRIAQGIVTLRRERTSLNDIIEAAINDAQSLIRDREQYLNVACPREPVWLDADAQRLQQVLSNLLTNASKFTGRHGRITVRVEPGPEAVIVRVRDTGRGIAADVLPRIFELFAQATPDERGLGIGLAVVRGLVEAHGGRVEARSSGPGQGSEFTVHLPVTAMSV